MSAGNSKDSAMAKLASYRDWRAKQSPSRCRLVHYSGGDCLGGTDIPLPEVEKEIAGLLAEAFYVDWAMHEDVLYLRVWEYPENTRPEWDAVLAERPLYDSVEVHNSLPEPEQE